MKKLKMIVIKNLQTTTKINYNYTKNALHKSFLTPLCEYLRYFFVSSLMSELTFHLAYMFWIFVFVTLVRMFVKQSKHRNL